MPEDITSIDLDDTDMSLQTAVFTVLVHYNKEYADSLKQYNLFINNETSRHYFDFDT